MITSRIFPSFHVPTATTVMPLYVDIVIRVHAVGGYLGLTKKDGENGHLPWVIFRGESFSLINFGHIDFIE